MISTYNYTIIQFTDANSPALFISSLSGGSQLDAVQFGFMCSPSSLVCGEPTRNSRILPPDEIFLLNLARILILRQVAILCPRDFRAI